MSNCNEFIDVFKSVRSKERGDLGVSHFALLFDLMADSFAPQSLPALGRETRIKDCSHCTSQRSRVAGRGWR